MDEVLWKATDREWCEFFENMTDSEAETFFKEFLQFRGERLSALSRKFWQTGGGNESDLDFSVDSLVPLWDWAKKQFHRREFSPSGNECIKNSHVSIWQNDKPPLSEDSLILINELAYYLAEVLIRTLDGVRWQICRTKVKRYVDRNQPVLGGFSAPGFQLGINLRDRVASLARKTLDGQTGEITLLQVYEQCFHAKSGEQHETRY